MRGLNVGNINQKKFQVIPFSGDWKEAFDEPEATGVWFIYGDSGAGKSSLSIQLAKELSKTRRVGVNSLEEGISLPLRKRIKQNGLEPKDRVVFYDRLNIEQLNELLTKRKSIDVIFLDTVQYLTKNAKNDQCEFMDIKALTNAHPSKLFVFVSQCENKKPLGSVALKLLFDAALKIYVEGFRAFSKGRFKGPKGTFDIDKKLAFKYHGTE